MIFDNLWLFLGDFMSTTIQGIPAPPVVLFDAVANIGTGGAAIGGWLSPWGALVPFESMYQIAVMMLACFGWFLLTGALRFAIGIFVK